MKSNLVLFLSLLLSFPLLASAATNSKTVKIDSPVRVAAKQLKPGTYKVEWNGTEPNVEVQFLRNNKEVFTAPAKLLPETGKLSPAEYGPALVEHKGPNNSKVLDEIDFKNMALSFHRIPTGA